jgi:hypothetical protein
LVLGNNFSSISGYLDTNYYRDIVETNKNIFPHFYKLKTNYVLDNYEHLDKFICYFYKFFTGSIPITYRFLLEYHNNNLLQFYNKLVKFDKSIFNKISTFSSSMFKSQRNKLARNELDYSYLFSEYIINSNFSIYTNIIQQSFNYEHSIIEYKFSNCKNTIYKSYQYNMLDIDYNKPSIQDIKTENICFSFNKCNNSLIIKKVNFKNV